MQNLNGKDCRRASKGHDRKGGGQYEHRILVCHKMLGSQTPLIPTTSKNIE